MPEKPKQPKERKEPDANLGRIKPREIVDEMRRAISKSLSAKNDDDEIDPKER